jgi:hypothetical protein
MAVHVPAIHPRDASLLRARPQDTKLRAGLLSKWFNNFIERKNKLYKNIFYII